MLGANDADGNPLIPENSHGRLGASAVNDGAQILRRSYFYDKSLLYRRALAAVAATHEFEAGLLFFVSGKIRIPVSSRSST